MKFTWLFAAIGALLMATTTQADCGCVPGGPDKEGHKIKITLKGLSNADVFLAAYYGPKQYYRDTVTVDENGVGYFEGDKPLKCGIYSIVMPKKDKYVEFIVNEQHFELETDTLDMVKNMKVKGSEENELFFNYLRFIGDQQKSAGPLRSQLKKEGLEKKEKTRLQDDLKKVDDAVKDYKAEIAAKHPDYLVTRVFKATDDPVLPTKPADADSTWSYRWFRAHYFDNIDFSDECLLRTPVFAQKLEYYLTKLVPQIPDSILPAATMLADKAKANREIFKYVVHTITNKYESSKIMCMDKVFVHMADNYYCNGLAWWTDSAQTKKICDRADKLRPLRCGERTPNVILQDTTEEKWVNLYHSDAAYTVLFFWDPSCGHCKKSMPTMKEFYDTFKPRGVEIFGVCTEFETGPWKKFLDEKEIHWSEVSDNPEINKNAYEYLKKGVTTLESLNFRDTYDIYSTPVIYVLNWEKKILAKRLGAEQLGDFIENYDKAHDKRLRDIK